MKKSLCRAYTSSFRVPDEDEPEVRTVKKKATKVTEDKSKGIIRTLTAQLIVTESTQKSSKGFKSSELIGRTYVGDSTTPSIWRSEPIAREMGAIKLDMTGINNGHMGVALGINPTFPRNKKIRKYLFPIQDPPLHPRDRELAFTDLPPEIRNKIYKYLLVTPKVVVDPYGWFPLVPSRVPGTYYHEHGTMLSLRKTCRLVYKEGTELVYGHTFVFRSHHDLYGFLSQLTPALRNLPTKIFRKVVLHIGQDKHRITSTFNLLTENDKVHETRGVGHHLPNPKMESRYALAQGWTKAIRTLLHRHQVQELVLVAGQGNRALLTNINSHKPLMRNLLTDTFHVDNLTILDINPAKILSEYKLPKKLKAIWENTESSVERYNPNWEEEVMMSADEEDAEASDEEGTESTDQEGTTESTDEERTESTDEEKTESTDEDGTGSADEQETASADEEESGLESGTDTDNGSDGYSGSNGDVNQYQSAALMDNAQSSKDPGSLQSTLDRAGGLATTAKITHGEEFTDTPIDPIMPGPSSILLPHQVVGRKRDFEEYKKDIEPLDVAMLPVPEWYDPIKAPRLFSTDTFVQVSTHDSQYHTWLMSVEVASIHLLCFRHT